MICIEQSADRIRLWPAEDLEDLAILCNFHAVQDAVVKRATWHEELVEAAVLRDETARMPDSSLFMFDEDNDDYCNDDGDCIDSYLIPPELPSWYRFSAADNRKGLQFLDGFAEKRMLEG